MRRAMKASKFSDAQKTFILKQGNDGVPVAEICRKAGISRATCFNRKKSLVRPLSASGVWPRNSWSASIYSAYRWSEGAPGHDGFRVPAPTKLLGLRAAAPSIGLPGNAALPSVHHPLVPPADILKFAVRSVSRSSLIARTSRQNDPRDQRLFVGTSNRHQMRVGSVFRLEGPRADRRRRVIQKPQHAA